MSEIFSDFEENVNERHREMIADLESISVDELKAKGVTLSFGGKVFKFGDLEIIDEESLEERIKAEFREKLNVQQTRVREKINNKVNQLFLMHQQKTEELARKERNLKEKYKKTAMMPDISEKDALEGLSVAKGEHHGTLNWYYKALYNPRFIIHVIDNEYDRLQKKRKALPSNLVTRCKKEFILKVSTKGDQITNIETKRVLRSGNFTDLPHYHQTGNGDCWGSWNSWKDAKWKTGRDIIRWCKEAEAVLETINHGSIAKSNPSGLPRLQTILDAVEHSDEIKATTVETNSIDDDDVWQSS